MPSPWTPETCVAHTLDFVQVFPDGEREVAEDEPYSLHYIVGPPSQSSCIKFILRSWFTALQQCSRREAHTIQCGQRQAHLATAMQWLLELILET